MRSKSQILSKLRADGHITDEEYKALDQEPSEDAISRKSIKQKLQEHHDFFVNAYGGFSNLPLNDKSRVDEITNCIAMVVNEPPVTPQEPKTGHWIMPVQDDGMSDPIYYQVRCSECGFDLDPQTWHVELHQYGADKYCPKCGRKMYEDKGVLEQLAEKQNNLSATNKEWSDVIEKNGYVN